MASAGAMLAAQVGSTIVESIDWEEMSEDGVNLLKQGVKRAVGQAKKKAVPAANAVLKKAGHEGGKKLKDVIKKSNNWMRRRFNDSGNKLTTDDVVELYYIDTHARRLARMYGIDYPRGGTSSTVGEAFTHMRAVSQALRGLLYNDSVAKEQAALLYLQRNNKSLSSENDSRASEYNPRLEQARISAGDITSRVDGDEGISVLLENSLIPKPLSEPMHRREEEVSIDSRRNESRKQVRSLLAALFRPATAIGSSSVGIQMAEMVGFHTRSWNGGKYAMNQRFLDIFSTPQRMTISFDIRPPGMETELDNDPVEASVRITSPVFTLYDDAGTSYDVPMDYSFAMTIGMKKWAAEHGNSKGYLTRTEISQVTSQFEISGTDTDVDMASTENNIMFSAIGEFTRNGSRGTVTIGAHGDGLRFRKVPSAEKANGLYFYEDRGVTHDAATIMCHVGITAGSVQGKSYLPKDALRPRGLLTVRKKQEAMGLCSYFSVAKDRWVEAEPQDQIYQVINRSDITHGDAWPYGTINTWIGKLNDNYGSALPVASRFLRDLLLLEGDEAVTALLHDKSFSPLRVVCQLVAQLMSQSGSSHKAMEDIDSYLDFMLGSDVIRGMVDTPAATVSGNANGIALRVGSTIE